MKMVRLYRLVSLIPLLILLGTSFGQKDILKDIARALQKPKPVAEIISRLPITVVVNDETLFNLFRSYLPPVSSVEFIALSELPERFEYLTTTKNSLVIIVDRSRGDFPIEYRQIVPYDLTLIRRQDVIIAGNFTKSSGAERYTVFLSAPSFVSLKRVIESFCSRHVRELKDLNIVEANPIPISVVITNAGQEFINTFAQQTPLDFVWSSTDDLAMVQDLLVTETEVYLLLPPVDERLLDRLPFDLTLLAPNQSVAVRKSKGGKYWQILLYGAFPNALHGLIRRYADPKNLPEEAVVINHPVIGEVNRLLILPFGDIYIYRHRTGNFALQVIRAVQGAKLPVEITSATQPPQPFLDWTPFQEGLVEQGQISTLAKEHTADLVLCGKLLRFDTQTIRKQELSSRASPSADRKIWRIETVQVEKVTAQIETRLYNGQTGETIWKRTIEGSASKRESISFQEKESPHPPDLQPERVSSFVYDDRLYASAVSDAVADLVNAMREEVYWLKEPTAISVASPSISPTIPLSLTFIEGIIGQVNGEFIYVDIGANQGVQVGDTLIIYRKVLLKTERKTVSVEEEIGRAKVISVFPEACKAQILTPDLKDKLQVGLRARLMREEKQQK